MITENLSNDISGVDTDLPLLAAKSSTRPKLKLEVESVTLDIRRMDDMEKNPNHPLLALFKTHSSEAYNKSFERFPGCYDWPHIAEINGKRYVISNKDSILATETLGISNTLGCS